MTTKRKKGVLASFLAGAMALVGCSSNEINDEVRTPPKELPIATIVVKNYGTIEAELYPHIAPNTVNNFISLANSGFYDNLTFHRVIKNFMIQGGDPQGLGIGGPGYSIYGEFKSNGFDNPVKHERGVISMARTNVPNSAGSQFFIMHKDSSHLDGSYAAFGKVIEGIDVVDQIASVECNHLDQPVIGQVMKSVTVDTKGVDYEEPNKL